MTHHRVYECELVLSSRRSTCSPMPYRKAGLAVHGTEREQVQHEPRAVSRPSGGCE